MASSSRHGKKSRAAGARFRFLAVRPIACPSVPCVFRVLKVTIQSQCVRVSYRTPKCTRLLPDLGCDHRAPRGVLWRLRIGFTSRVPSAGFEARGRTRFSPGLSCKNLGPTKATNAMRLIKSCRTPHSGVVSVVPSHPGGPAAHAECDVHRRLARLEGFHACSRV